MDWCTCLALATTAYLVAVDVTLACLAVAVVSGVVVGGAWTWRRMVHVHLSRDLVALLGRVRADLAAIGRRQDETMALVDEVRVAAVAAANAESILARVTGGRWPGPARHVRRDPMGSHTRRKTR